MTNSFKSDFRRWLLNSAREEAEKYFNSETLLCIIPRETAWYAITLLESGQPTDVELANRILAQIKVSDGTHSPATLFVIYKRFKSLLTDKSKSNILDNLRTNLPISATVRYSDGNVNHPLAAYIHLICAGELLNQPVYTEIGKRYLQEFQLTISSRRHKKHLQAEMAEYNSPTYTAVTLWFLAIGAEFARDPEARELALFLEERLWMNVALHWHEPSQQFAGPFSRAYGEDSLGGFSALHCTFAYAMNTPIFIEPELPRRFRHPSALIENALVAILDFHLPEAARRIAFKKTWPLYFRMTTYCEQYHENGSRLEGDNRLFAFDDEIYPGGWGDLTTYLSDEYCLGTASRPYVNGGHNDVFSLRYRRAEQVKSLQDFRSIYTRMVFNSSKAGKDNFCHTVGTNIDRSYLYEEGRGFTYQHKNIAIVDYVPKRPGHKGVTEIRLDVIFPYYSPFDCLVVDNKTIVNLPCEFLMEQKIIIADHRTYLAIVPFAAVGTSEKRTVGKIWPAEDHLMISFFLYCGEKTDFEREQLSDMNAGFACLLETRNRFPFLEDFILYANKMKLTSEKLESHSCKFTLHIDRDEMIFGIDPVTERILQRTWNGNDESLCHTEVESEDLAVAEFVKKGPYSK